MIDPCLQLRAQIRELQGQRRSLESKLMQPQSLRAGSIVERYLRTGGAARARPAYYLSRSQQGRSKLTYVKKEELPALPAAVLRVPRLPTEPKNLATTHRLVAAVLEAVAASPIPIKYFW